MPTGVKAQTLKKRGGEWPGEVIYDRRVDFMGRNGVGFQTGVNCDTVEILDKRLHGHVKEYWKTRMGEDPMPENMDEAVDLYFEDNLEEWYKASEEGVIYE